MSLAVNAVRVTSPLFHYGARNILQQSGALCVKSGMSALNELKSVKYYHENDQFVCSICCQMAQQSITKRDYEKAIKSYKEALSYTESDSKVCVIPILYSTSLYSRKVLWFMR